MTLGPPADPAAERSLADFWWLAAVDSQVRLIALEGASARDQNYPPYRSQVQRRGICGERGGSVLVRLCFSACDDIFIFNGLKVDWRPNHIHMENV